MTEEIEKPRAHRIKNITKAVVGFSVGHCVSSIVRGLLAPQDPITKIEVTVGSYFLGAMAAKAAGQYTDAKIDEIVKSYDEAKLKVEEDKKAKAAAK